MRKTRLVALLFVVSVACGGGSTMSDGGRGGDASSEDGGTGPEHCRGDDDCGGGLACCDGRCVDVRSDIDDCGACGAPCPIPENGRASCEDGVCGLDSCNAGYKDCNQDLADGCEVHTDVDPSNCGACGNVCSFANGSGSCASGRCTLLGCGTGYASCDGNDSNGCETNLKTDADHCGSCDTVCTGSCVNGACQVVVGATVLASGEWPTSLAVDGTSLYWVSPPDGTVKKIPKGGGTPTTLANSQGAWDLAIDDSSVYWLGWSNDSVVKVPKGGGALTTLATGQSQPTGIAIQSGAVYWTNTGGNQVLAMPVTGGTATVLATGSAGSFGSIVVDGSAAYWTDDVSNKVMMAPKGGGTTIQLASGGIPAGIAIDGNSLYWIDNSAAGSVMRLSLSGGSPTTFAASQSYPHRVALDATSVYWTLGNGSVLKALKSGGAPSTLYTGTNTAVSGAPENSIVVDDRYVYWTNYTNGTVMRIAK